MMLTIPDVFCCYPNPISVTIWCPGPGLYSGKTAGIMVVTRTMLRRSGHGLECSNFFGRNDITPILRPGVRLRNNQHGRGRRFTNMAVPRFDGTGGWQRHLLIFQAIVKSNGRSPTTAAPVICTPRRGGIERSHSHASGGEGTMDGLCKFFF